ncbi:MAG TPA: hypothetical protein VGL07_17040 [Buttiauxella sp.]|jgi:hypothetical protein
MAIVGAIAQDSLSQYLKAYVTDKQGNTVIGFIGEGATAQLSAMWNSPFEGDSLGSIAGVSTLANVGQSKTEMTSVSKLNSEMIWQGSPPPSINLSLYFQAINDAKAEVDDAIKHLWAMMSPELNDIAPLGRRPESVVIDIGRRFKITDVLIQEVSYMLDAPKTPMGYYTHNTVTLQLTAKEMRNKSEIPNLFL